MEPLAQLDWGVAARPLPGETESGDGCFVKAVPSGWLVAVADGLGHGREAAAAKSALLEVLARYADDSLPLLLHRCHERLRTTRGMAISLASIEASSARMNWVGVGNVEGMLLHATPAAGPTAYITQRGGIVGYRLPEVHPAALPLHEDDLLIFATDGIREGFINAIARTQPPQQNADRILANYARPNDDALVLVARWRTASAGEGQTRT